MPSAMRNNHAVKPIREISHPVGLAVRSTPSPRQCVPRRPPVRRLLQPSHGIEEARAKDHIWATLSIWTEVCHSVPAARV